jgi:hypothetical protein
MNRVFYAVFDEATGAYLWGGQCDEADLQRQAGAGQYVIQTDTNPVAVTTVNLDPVRASLCNRIDAEAGAVRARFITVAPGQEMTYVFKANEAQSYVASDTDPTHYPFMRAEAAATDKTLDEVHASVLESTTLFIIIGARIEGARMAAKQAVNAADNANAMIAAATLDWAAVIQIDQPTT